MIGEQVLNYKIIAKLGEGGMGAVYVGSHLQLGRKAAIKALHLNLVSNPMIRERFKNEAATMALLKHPNIVGLYDYLETSNGLFLIMEYVQGKALDAFLAESGALPEPLIVALFAQVLDGFEYAHRQGVIHRDIKPSNLIITPQQEVKILDFGIAKLLDGSSKSLTQVGSRMGTVLYMSPEQVRGQEVDRRSDIYSLGVTLFQMLTGKPPYDEHTATEYEVYTQILNIPLPRAQSLCPTASPRLQSLIDKATAKSPADRFQSCAEFKKALLGDNYLSITQPSSGRLMQTSLGRTPALPSVASPSPETPPLAQPNHTPTDPQLRLAQRRRRWAQVYYWLSILLLLGGIGFASYTVLWNPFEIAALQKFALFAPTASQYTAEAKRRISAFYQAVESHDFEKIKPFYRPEIENYFNNLSRQLVPDVKAAYEIYWKTYIAERHTIDLDNLDYTQDEAGNHLVKFMMKYEFQGAKTKKWSSLDVKTEIRFDKYWKIYYINKIG